MAQHGIGDIVLNREEMKSKRQPTKIDFLACDCTAEQWVTLSKIQNI